MYIETSSKIHGKDVIVSWERTDIIQIRNITFCYNKYSTSTGNSLISMGRFKIQLLIEDNTWSTRYNIPKQNRYSDSSTDWTLVSLDFTVKKYDFKFFYNQTDTLLAGMCFSNIKIFLSVY